MSHWILAVERVIAAPPEALYRAWSEPAWLKRWFAPAPWHVISAELDVRPGGASLVVMGGPNGEESPCHGVYLEVVPCRRLVMTDAYLRAWEPSPRPFMTLVVTFTPCPGGTHYLAQAHHWSAADMQEHEAMGFHPGWDICTDQLEALVSGGA